MKLKNAIGMLVGAALGFAYYKVIGCASGACPLTSNPWISTLMGVMVGAMFAGNSNQTDQTKKSAEIRK